MIYKSPVLIPDKPYTYLCCERNLLFFLKEVNGTFFIYVQRESGPCFEFSTWEYIWEFSISYFVILFTAYAAGLPLPKDAEGFCCEITYRFAKNDEPHLLRVQMATNEESFYVSCEEAFNVLTVLKPWMT